MFAGSQLDVVLGFDIHMEMVPVPAPTPTPFPMPFVGQIELSPIGALLRMGLAQGLAWTFGGDVAGAVFVNSLYGAKTGDDAKNEKTLKHLVLPPGTAWTPLPRPLNLKLKPPPPPADSPAAPPGDAYITTGSQTVYFEGSNAARLGSIAMSCSDPVRLPSSSLLAVPKGAPVLVGGPDAIDWTTAARNVLLRNKWTAGLLQEIVFALAPLRLRGLISWAACHLTGHPVDVATGRLLTRAEDARLEAPIPLVFERFYSSSWSERPSTLGFGWSHTFDERIWVERAAVVYKMGDGREIEFPTLDLPDRRIRVGDEIFYPIDRLWLTRTAEGFRVRSADGLVRTFDRVPGNDAAWVLTRIEDREKHTATLQYDERGMLASVSSGARWMRFDHRDGFLRRVSLQVPESDGWYDRVTFGYSPEGDLTSATDSAHLARTYEYDAHLLVRETDRDGVSFFFEYDGRDALARCVRTWGDDQQGSDRLFFREISYDPANSVTAVENSFGHTTIYRMNVANAVVEVTDPHGASTRYEFDDHLWKTATIDAMGRATRHQYDERGNETKRTLPNGATFALSYDQDDRLVEVLDPRGERTTWTYADPANWAAPRTRLRAYRSPSRTARYHYDGPRTVMDVDGRVLVVERDPNGQISKVTYPNGRTEERWYDRQGRLVKTRDHRGRVWRFVYDWESRLRQVVEPGAIARRYEYSGEGDLVDYSDAIRHVTYGYSGHHKVAWCEEGGARTEYRYTSEDELVVVLNEASERHTIARDACGRVVEQIGFDGRKTVTVRDDLGRPTTIYKPSKKAQYIEYTALDRIAHVNYGDGFEETFTYDATGALETATNAAGTVRFDRDAAGRVLRESFGGEWVDSAYEAGARTQVSSSLGLVERIERDVMNRVAGVDLLGQSADGISRSAWRVGFQRDSLGREVGRSLPGGVTTRWERTESGLPETFTVEAGAAILAQSRYAWEGDSRLTAEWTAGRGNTTYAHDARNRLVASATSEGQIVWRSPDATGNLYRNRERAGRRYGRGGVLLEAEGTSYSYDADGNLVAKTAADGRAWRYAWNPDGTLAQVTDPDGREVAFRYDALHRRIEKRAEGRVTAWTWDANVPVHETLVEDGARGTTTWLFEPDTFAPLGKVQPDGRRLSVVTDYLGSPIEMVDEAGRLAWKAQLDIYGVAHVEEGRAEDCPWRWPGQYEDRETGLRYNHFRYYDAETGAYTSQDPLGLGGGLEAYGYVEDPLAWIDPYGLTACGSPAEQAAAFQGKGDYPGVDDWENVTLKKGTVVYGGVPGQGAFYTTAEGLEKGGGTRAGMAAALQVKRHKVAGFRPGMTAYVVTQDTPAAFAVTRANMDWGPGGAPQLYVPDYQNVLEATYSIPLAKD